MDDLEDQNQGVLGEGEVTPENYQRHIENVRWRLEDPGYTAKWVSFEDNYAEASSALKGEVAENLSLATSWMSTGAVPHDVQGDAADSPFFAGLDDIQRADMIGARALVNGASYDELERMIAHQLMSYHEPSANPL